MTGPPRGGAGAVRPHVVVVATGVANLASVSAAFGRLGVHARVATSADEIAEAAAVVLPGVGSFAAARRALDQSGDAEAVADRVRRRAPTLAICLGMQLLCEGSSEAQGVPGLAVVPGFVGRFKNARWIPQLGWNGVTPSREGSLIEGGHAYFAHSYRLVEPPPGWAPSWSESGERFVSGFEDEGVLACQFHPELSGAWGQELLARWCDRAGVLPC